MNIIEIKENKISKTNFLKLTRLLARAVSPNCASGVVKSNTLRFDTFLFAENTPFLPYKNKKQKQKLN